MNGLNQHIDPNYGHLSKKAEAKKRENAICAKIENGILELTSTLIWLKEYIFQKAKYNDVSEEELRLFVKLEKMEDKFDKYFNRSKIEKENLMSKRDALVKESMGVLRLSDEVFVEFISDKKNGVYAKRIAESGLAAYKAEQENRK